MKRRGSGILLHITSLPSKYGIGDFGPEAYRFADFLHQSKQIFWQVLPLTPTSPISGSSPYASSSAFAGNKLLISPELLLQDGFLSQADLDHSPDFPVGQVDYEAVIENKNILFHKAFEKFNARRDEFTYEYEKFCTENEHWLEDYASFIAFKDHFDKKAWSEWPQEIRDRELGDMQNLKNELSTEIEFEKFFQFIFSKQWSQLKGYCNDHGIQIIGDVPYYVNYDSADVWTNPHIFKLDLDKKPSFVAGVPPDYFSETGQLWGNPVYNWDVLQESQYDWWIQRMLHSLSLYDVVRIDHFRGFLAYWEVAASEETAINGSWVETPADDFFNTMLQRFPELPILAEDLGVITPDVRELMHKFDIPGMKLLIFAFDESLPHNPYAPHNHIKDCVVYTGTHDNNTIRGWFEQEAPDDMKLRFSEYIGREVSAEDVHKEFVRLVMMSVANLVIIPIQDVLGLGAEHRMNRPATSDGNWRWRLLPDQITENVTGHLKQLVELYGRS